VHDLQGDAAAYMTAELETPNGVVVLSSAFVE